MRITSHTFLTLDGVMQGPGGPDEDRSDGFSHGGWSIPVFSEGAGEAVDGWFKQAAAFLLGRKTWQTFASFWPQVDEPGNAVAELLNSLPKYAVSNTLAQQDLTWAGSQLLSGDFLARIRELREQPGGELQVHGSHQLLRALHDAGLVDEYRIIVFPVVLGEGKRLFDPGARDSAFEVKSTRVLPDGTVIQELLPRPYVRNPGQYAVEDGKETIVPSPEG